MRVMNEIAVDGYQVDLIRDGETFQCEMRSDGARAAFKSKAYRDARSGDLTFRDASGEVVRVSQLTKLFKIDQKF